MSEQKIKVTFYGGVEEVTGANFLLDIVDNGGEHKILIDCGLAQGSEFSKNKNREPFPYNPKDIDILMITHAHIDHIGRVPKLVHDGFKGKIISTPETLALAPLMLEDAWNVMDHEAREEGILPLYEKENIEQSIRLWSTLPYSSPRELFSEVSVVARDAGHVLGSAIYEIFVGNKKIVFTGDLGNSPSPLLRDTEKITGADYMIIESVYGDREHESRDERRNLLADVVRQNIRKGGVLLIPVFSLEKTQIILSELNFLIEKQQIPNVPVFLDSPLAIKITEVYKNSTNLFNEESRKTISSGDDLFHFPKLHFTETRMESEAISHFKNPKIIMAGSGMSTGGRITEHEKRYLGDPKNTILFVGYQSAGSLGRQIEEGLKQVEINNSVISVRAEIKKIHGYSSHKDMNGLVYFVENSADTLKKVFVVMGEPKSSFFLANRLRDYLGVDAVHPEEGESFVLD